MTPTRRHLVLAAAACAAVAITAPVALAAKGGGGGGSKGPSAKPLVVSGSVEGLYPGGTLVLDVVVTNPNTVAISIATVTEAASDAGPECPASVLTFVPPAPGQRIAAGATAAIPVAVTMATDAGDACQGATFPVRHTVTATKAR